MAFSIMLYHFSVWTFGTFDSSTLLGKLGVYGVSIFYVLSGLTLHIVYAESPSDLRQLKKFFFKRFLRIYPLLWLVTLIYVFASSVQTDAFGIFLNLSGVFGFVEPDAAIGIGVWSIGNELVFYSLFPLILLSEKINYALYYAVQLLILLVSIIFAFHILQKDSTLESQWSSYVNPFNQLFLFSGGMLISHFSKKFKPVLRNEILLMFIISLVLAFTIYPVEGDLIHLVTGWDRVSLSTICLLICTSVFLLSMNQNSLIHEVLLLLGETSYSIYLLHPIVYSLLKTINNKFLITNEPLIFFSAIAITLLASIMVYRLFEKPLLKIGASIAMKQA
jgi:peptidoglycan/LPS O-acetylase OafA/YrhL